MPNLQLVPCHLPELISTKSPPEVARGEATAAGAVEGVVKLLSRVPDADRVAAATAAAAVAAGLPASAGTPVPAGSDCRRASKAASLASSNFSISLLMMAVREDQSIWPGPVDAAKGAHWRVSGRGAWGGGKGSALAGQATR